MKLLGYQGNEIIDQLLDWFGDQTFSRTQVYYWRGELNTGRTEHFIYFKILDIVSYQQSQNMNSRGIANVV